MQIFPHFDLTIVHRARTTSKQTLLRYKSVPQWEVGCLADIELRYDTELMQSIPCPPSSPILTPTCFTDFLDAMSDGSGVDLSQLRVWYGQAGTPEVHVEVTQDTDAGTVKLTCR